MEKFPLVSVIIPTYNSTIFLEKAIQSICEQTYANVELIIVDDCSNNGTREKLIAMQNQKSFKLILLEKNNGSPSKALNEGIKIAKGKYISICAHDDYYQPDKLTTQVDFLEKNPEFVMVHSKNYTVYHDENKLTILKTMKRHSGNIFKELLLQKFYIAAVTVMIRKDVFEKIGYFDETLLIEDWDMWLRIANVYPIAFINKYLACYRMHEHNTSIINTNKMITNRNLIIEKWKNTAYYAPAISINRLIDGRSLKESFLTLLQDTLSAVINTKQPYRVFRLFLSNIKRHFKTQKSSA